MYTTTPSRSDEPRRHRDTLLGELVVGVTMIVVLTAAIGGAYATEQLLGIESVLALPAAFAVALAIAIAIPLVVTGIGRAGRARLEARRRRRRKPQPTPPATLPARR